MIGLRRLPGLVLAAVAILALAASSRVRVPLHADDHARLRVAFSARPERIESCRTLSDEELATLPAHMRQRVVCEGVTAAYRMEIRRDGVLIDTTVLRGGGLRRDRQLYVFRELLVPNGRATFEVRMTRLGDDGAGTDEDPDDEPGDHDGTSDDSAWSRGAEGDHDDDDDEESRRSRDRDRREREEHRRRVEDEVPKLLLLRDTVTLSAREVVLVTYDHENRRLRMKRDGQ